MTIAQHNIQRIETLAAAQHRSEDEVLNELIERALPPEPLPLKDKRELAARQKAAMLELLKEMEGFPLGDLNESFSEDIDRIVYGGKD